MIHTVVIDGERLDVPASEVPAIKDALLEAVRAGARYVTIGRPAFQIEVLVGPATQIRWEHIIVAEERERGPSAASRQVSSLDWEWTL